MHNLVSAAAATGVNRSTILRAIKAGRISAQRDETNGWQIDPAELHRVFPPLPSSATTATQLGATTDALVAELRAVIADLRRDRDAWREAFENAQRLLPRPTQPDAIAMPGLSNTPPATTEQLSRFCRAWRWMRATGCLAGAGLLLALSTVPAGAQQQQPQQPPPPGCFTVEMSHSTQGNPQGSILLDRCTGKTWLLLCIRNDTAGCAFRWAPIPDATEPAGGP
jgi:hypothetical protein